MVKKIFLIFVVFLTWSCISPKGQETETASSYEPQTSYNEPFLWKATHQGHDSYFMGTIHMGVHPILELPPIVWEKFRGTKKLLLEANVYEANQKELLTLAKYSSEEDSLEKEIGQENWVTLQKISETQDDRFKNYRPWYVIISLMQLLVPPTPSMDNEFFVRAKVNQKKIAFLETWQEQIKLFIEITGKVELNELLKNWDEQKKQAGAMITLYKNGNLEELTKFFQDKEKNIYQNPEAMMKLLNQRNEDWLPKIVNEIEKGPTFVAVGLAHFVGKKGLVELLKEKNIILERIKVPTKQQ